MSTLHTNEAAKLAALSVQAMAHHARIEAMKAKNQHRLSVNLSIAYGEEAFLAEAAALEQIASELRTKAPASVQDTAPSEEIGIDEYIASLDSETRDRIAAQAGWAKESLGCISSDRASPAGSGVADAAPVRKGDAPVAWLTKGGNLVAARPGLDGVLYGWMPLYDHPLPAVDTSITNVRIAQLADDNFSTPVRVLDVLAFARAILAEASHKKE